MEDWRLVGQEDCWNNEQFIKQDVRNYYETAKKEWENKKTDEYFWDHDHCEFCGEKFMIETADKNPFAYCTDDYYHWVCENCFNDFKERFNFMVKD